MKKGSVERLQSELENTCTKEQLQYLREEKGNRKRLCYSVRLIVVYFEVFLV